MFFNRYDDKEQLKECKIAFESQIINKEDENKINVNLFYLDFNFNTNNFS